MKRSAYLFASFVALLLAGCAAGSRSEAAAARGIEPQANETLRRMTYFLQRQKTLAFSAQQQLSGATRSGPRQLDVRLERPNRFRAASRGADGEVLLTCDGREAIVYDSRSKQYQSVRADRTPERTAARLDRELRVSTPLAPLIAAQPFEALTAGVEAGEFLGVEVVDGVECDHLGFSGRDSDFEIWIATGAQPTPKRLIVNRREGGQAVVLTSQFTNWSFAPAGDDDEFTFVPPAGAQRVRPRGARDREETDEFADDNEDPMVAADRAELDAEQRAARADRRAADEERRTEAGQRRAAEREMERERRQVQRERREIERRDREESRRLEALREADEDDEDDDEDEEEDEDDRR